MEKKKCLIVVDMQKDFACLDGSLYVKGGEEIITPINNLMARFKLGAKNNFVIASRDWHPGEHRSFKINGGEWPIHCVSSKDGSKLIINEFYIDMIINKGKNKDVEEYSCIITKEIENLVKSYNEIYVCGLAGDFCVKNTIDALVNALYIMKKVRKYKIFFIEDLVKDVYPENRGKLIEELKKLNVRIINSKEIIK